MKITLLITCLMVTGSRKHVMAVSQVNNRMKFFKQMNVTLFISVLLIIPTLVNSRLMINEFKLWGNASSQFIEIHNTDNNTDVPFSSNYSVFLLDEPINATSGLQVFHVIDVSEYDVVNASGYIGIKTPNISLFINETNTFYAIVLHKLINGSDFEIGQVILKEDLEDSVVFTEGKKMISLLSYKLKKVHGHQVLDIMEDYSLNACNEDPSEEVHLYEFKKPSSGQPNLCKEPVLTTTATTAASIQMSTSPTTLNTSTTVNSSSETSAIPVTSPEPGTTTEPATSVEPSSSSPSITTLVPTIPTTIYNLIDPSNLTINEFNTYIGDHSQTKFIEIHGQPNAHFARTTFEIIDGGDGSVKMKFNITHTDMKGLFVIKFPSLPISLKCVIMAIKQEENVIDGLIISQDGSVEEGLKEMYSATREIFILDPSVVNISADSAISVSKCGRFPGIVNGGFMLTASSMGEQNNCSTFYHQKIQLKLKNGDCKLFKDNVVLKNKVAAAIIRSTSKICKCGLSLPVLQDRSIHCGSVIFEAYIKTLTKQENENYYKIYQQFVNNTKKITVDNKVYEIDNTCYTDCYVHSMPTSKKDDGDISVTIAIVVTCVVIFIVIVIIVIILLKKKRNGTLQFSMVRLEEDNNLLMDDAKGVRFREGSAIII